jgi:hypothetical protein
VLPELLDFIKILLVAGLGVIGWWVKALAKRIDDLEHGIHEFRLHVATDYASWAGLKELIKETESRVVAHIKQLEDMLHKVIEIKPKGDHD